MTRTCRSSRPRCGARRRVWSPIIRRCVEKVPASASSRRATSHSRSSARTAGATGRTAPPGRDGRGASPSVASGGSRSDVASSGRRASRPMAIRSSTAGRGKEAARAVLGPHRQSRERARSASRPDLFASRPRASWPCSCGTSSSASFDRSGTLARVPPWAERRARCCTTSMGRLGPDGTQLAVVRETGARSGSSTPPGTCSIETAGWIGEMRFSPRRPADRVRRSRDAQQRRRKRS